MTFIPFSFFVPEDVLFIHFLVENKFSGFEKLDDEDMLACW